MFKETFRHDPQYFQFYIQDPVHYDTSVSRADFDEAESSRFICKDGRLAIFVQSEFSEIPITVEFTPVRVEVETDPKWERIVECPLHIYSGEIVLCGCPDGPVYGRFGEVVAEPGPYVVRIYYGGQATLEPDGATRDFYLVQIWPEESENPEVIRVPA